jgi:hypothetical protein
MIGLSSMCQISGRTRAGESSWGYLFQRAIHLMLYAFFRRLEALCIIPSHRPDKTRLPET